ncbi:MAG TPA: hypothetical protein VFE53_02830 [Mucilaginibacter sp.]|jgi:acetolactate synthase small subunit|nr:hypothetical protein [Mucilaginibacter sp.]
MKKSTAHQDQFIFSIYADDKKGLLGQLLVFFNRRYYEVHSLNASRTDISDLVLITVEAIVPESEVHSLQQKLQRIIEVYRVDIYPGARTLKKIGFYRLSIAAQTPVLWTILDKYGAAVSSTNADSFVIRKTGSDNDLAELYNLLEGQHLLSFCKSGLIMDESLSTLEELENVA